MVVKARAAASFTVYHLVNLGTSVIRGPTIRQNCPISQVLRICAAYFLGARFGCGEHLLDGKGISRPNRFSRRHVRLQPRAVYYAEVEVPWQRRGRTRASHLSFCTTSPRPLWPVGPQPRAIMRGRHGLLRPSACREIPLNPSECCLREAPMQPRPCFHLTSWSESHRFAGPVARWLWGSGTSVMGLRAESPANERNASGRT
jgi:hypothetical protein